MRRLPYLFFSSLFFILFHCSDRQIKEPIENNYSCSDSSDLPNYPENFIKREASKDYLENPLLKHKFSRKSLNIANAYGMIPFLKRLIKLKDAEGKKANSHDHALELNKLKLRLNAAIKFATIDITGSASEMHCYSERMNDFLRVLQNRERESIKNYTILSILVTAGFTILSGGVQWQSDTVQSGVNLIGGAFAGFLGYKATTYSIEIDFIPEKKVLEEFWNPPVQSSIFSEPLWYLINHQPDLDNKEKSLRKELIHHWAQSYYLEIEDLTEREAAISSFFDPQKKHTIEDLISIREMNRQIGISIQLTLQDIKLLDREIDLNSENQQENDEF